MKRWVRQNWPWAAVPLLWLVGMLIIGIRDGWGF